MNEPKFKPGDLVMFRVGIEQVKLSGDFVKCHMVIESHVITCPGGTQICYKLGGGSDNRTANEIELEVWDVDKAAEATQTGRDRNTEQGWRGISRSMERRKEGKEG